MAEQAPKMNTDLVVLLRRKRQKWWTIDWEMVHEVREKQTRNHQSCSWDIGCQFWFGSIDPRRQIGYGKGVSTVGPPNVDWTRKELVWRFPMSFSTVFLLIQMTSSSGLSHRVRRGFTIFILSPSTRAISRNTWSPLPRKFKRTSSAVKVMTTVFWNCDGAILVDFVEKGNTIYKKYYSDELRWLCDANKQKRLGGETDPRSAASLGQRLSTNSPTSGGYCC